MVPCPKKDFETENAYSETHATISETKSSIDKVSHNGNDVNYCILFKVRLNACSYVLLTKVLPQSPAISAGHSLAGLNLREGHQSAAFRWETVQFSTTYTVEDFTALDRRAGY